MCLINNKRVINFISNNWSGYLLLTYEQLLQQEEHGDMMMEVAVS